MENLLASFLHVPSCCPALMLGPSAKLTLCCKGCVGAAALVHVSRPCRLLLLRLLLRFLKHDLLLVDLKCSEKPEA